MLIIILLIKDDVNNNSFYVIINIIYNLFSLVQVVGPINTLIMLLTMYVTSSEQFQLQPVIIVESIIPTEGFALVD